MAVWASRSVNGLRAGLTIRRNSQRRRIAKALGLLVLLPGAAVMLYPLVWMVLSSFETNRQILQFPPQIWPHPWSLSGFVGGLTTLPFGRYFVNTAIIAFFSSVGGVFSSSLAGFAFAKFRVRGKNILFLLVLSGLMVPYAVVMIPQYLLFSTLGWVDTFLPLIVPSWLGLPFLVFLFRQFFAGIPDEVFDAAKVDGCGHFRLYWNIALPLATPAVAAAFIFHVQASWNEFLPPLIYLNSHSNYTLALGLASFRSTCNCTPWNQLMAASLVTALVPIVFFFLAQRYILRGIAFTSR